METIDTMGNEPSGKPQRKSTLLLIIALFFLFNAVLMFRAGINTLYFTKDTSSDYATVQATLTGMRNETNASTTGQQPRIIPVFTFTYNGNELTMEAPGLAFTSTQGRDAFEQGKTYTLWIHKYRGELVLPPKAGLAETGRSQLLTSAIFFCIAAVAWMIRGRTGAAGGNKDRV